MKVLFGQAILSNFKGPGRWEKQACALAEMLRGSDGHVLEFVR